MRPEARVQPPPPEAKPASGPATPLRLGLALSGGGFRATLFHLGVMVRLAELDLLRHLHVISAVSGGSILAAHYMLRLKVALEASSSGRLSRDEYVALLGRVGGELREAIAQQPRCRLLDRPVDMLRFMFLGSTRHRLTLSDRMASLYQRYLFASATREVKGAGAEDIAHGMSLARMHVRLAALPAGADLERFNASGAGDHVPKLVLNAATLNTGCKFIFTFSEVGDEMLGYVRSDERTLLAGYKLLLRGYTPTADMEQAASRAVESVATARLAAARDEPSLRGPERFVPRRYTAEHLAWWAAARAEQAARRDLPGRSAELIERSRGERMGVPLPEHASFHSAAVRHLLRPSNDPTRFLDVPLGTLRTAKVAAWYVLDRTGWSENTPTGPVKRGGFTPDEHRGRFWQAICEIDSSLATASQSSQDEEAWLEFVLELYWFRVAENLFAGSPEDITLPTAVQASANFPPVFGPLELDGLYDTARVKRLRLSDGGLNDNNGIETLLDERCTHIIASDAGPGPGAAPDVGGNRLGMMGKIVVNQLTIVRRLQLRTLREQARVHEMLAAFPAGAPSGPAAEALASLRSRYPVEAIAFFQIDSNLRNGIAESATPPPLPPHPLAPDIVRLRTDLDGFADIEQDALLYQGYQFCDRFVRRYVYADLVARELVPPLAPPAVAPARLPDTHAEWDRAKAVLGAGALLFGRALRIGGVWRLFYLLAVAGLLGAGGLVGWLAWEGLMWFVHAPSLPSAFAPGLRWVIAGIVFALFAEWLSLVLFGKWQSLDGVLADFSTRAQRPPGPGSSVGAIRLQPSDDSGRAATPPRAAA